MIEADPCGPASKQFGYYQCFTTLSTVLFGSDTELSCKTVPINYLYESVHSKDHQHRVSDHKTDHTHDDTCLDHILLLDHTCCMSDGIRRRADRKHHCE